MSPRAAGKELTAYDIMDALRALAAILVVSSHVRNILFLGATARLSAPWKIFYFATGFGHQAVMIFFVLSGYWITKTVTRRNVEAGFAWSDYLIDRLSRLWIVLIPALVLGGILDSIGTYGTEAPIYFGIQGTNTLTWNVASRLSLSNFAGSLAFVQSLLVEPFGSNGPLWSLANEFWYYIWFPILFSLLRGRRLSTSANVLALTTMIAFRQLLPGFACWLFGSLLFYITQYTTMYSTPRRGMMIATILFFFGVLSFSRLPHLPIDGWIKDMAVSGSFALLLFFIIRSQRTYPRWIEPFCRYGARSSYSLYVVHFPLVVLLAALFVAPAHRLPPSGRTLLSFVAIGFVAIIYGYAVSALTEANTSKLRRLLKSRYSSVVRNRGNIWGGADS